MSVGTVFITGVILGSSGWAMITMAGIWVALIAFGESTRQGLLSLFVPFYVFYYAMSRLNDARKTRKPFLLGLVGLSFWMLGSVLFVFTFGG